MPPKSQPKIKLASRQPRLPPPDHPPSILRHTPAPTAPPPSRISTVYLVYIHLRTARNNPPKLVVRKIYDSQVEALQAFKREYGVWMTSLFPARHSEDQLAGSYMVNLMEMSKRKGMREGEEERRGSGLVEGKGKVEYAIVHRADVDLDDENPKRRVCVVGCEETDRVMN